MCSRRYLLCFTSDRVVGWRGTTCATDWYECVKGIHQYDDDATCMNSVCLSLHARMPGQMPHAPAGQSRDCGHPRKLLVCHLRGRLHLQAQPRGLRQLLLHRCMSQSRQPPVLCLHQGQQHSGVGNQLVRRVQGRPLQHLDEQEQRQGHLALCLGSRPCSPTITSAATALTFEPEHFHGGGGPDRVRRLG